MIEVDSIELLPDRFGWMLRLNVPPEDGYQATAYEYALGDAIQFHAETERTIGKWLADGPADFHNAPDPTPTRADLERDAYLAHVRSDDPENDPEVAAAFDRLNDPDLARDIERGK